eukprot:TRINITY_DN33081_c0_g1_i1.p1 TRINITY_DN33081_c0_g1~~TRINITY_DN33081_c0_g1_i1.p1  ORF type:complete len:131 (+),score=31.28 TRINITY_DN33081_c0_g1_i1:65-457(+)
MASPSTSSAPASMRRSRSRVPSAASADREIRQRYEKMLRFKRELTFRGFLYDGVEVHNLADPFVVHELVEKVDAAERLEDLQQRLSAAGSSRQTERAALIGNASHSSGNPPRKPTPARRQEDYADDLDYV